MLSRQKAAGRNGEKEDDIIKNPADSMDYLRMHDASHPSQQVPIYQQERRPHTDRPISRYTFTPASQEAAAHPRALRPESGLPATRNVRPAAGMNVMKGTALRVGPCSAARSRPDAEFPRLPLSPRARQGHGRNRSPHAPGRGSVPPRCRTRRSGTRPSADLPPCLHDAARTGPPPDANREPYRA